MTLFFKITHGLVKIDSFVLAIHFVILDLLDHVLSNIAKFIQRKVKPLLDKDILSSELVRIWNSLADELNVVVVVKSKSL